MEQKKRIECHVMGRVQMVMFRDFAKRTARTHELCGYARNEEDGSVTIVAEGEEGALRMFIKEIQKGSLLSRIDDVNIVWREPTGEFTRFTIQ